MMILHHKERTDTLKMVKVANEFLWIMETRLAIFKRLEKVDKNARGVYRACSRK